MSECSLEMIDRCVGYLCRNILADTCSTAGTSSMVAGISCLCTGSAPCGVQSQWLAESGFWQYQSTGRLAVAKLSWHTVGSQSLSDGERYQFHQSVFGSKQAAWSAMCRLSNYSCYTSGRPLHLPSYERSPSRDERWSWSRSCRYQ